MGKQIFGLLIVLLSTLSGFSQQFSLRQYTVLDGLPQSVVNMLLEDKNGYLWVGTHGGGLARFDGRAFKVYTTRDGLLSNIVQYLKLDSHQNLWIVHPRGVTRFDGEKFRQFKPGVGNASRRIRRVFELNDSIFFVTGQGTCGKIYKDSIYYWNEPVRRDKMILYTHLLPTRDVALYLNDSSFLVRTVKGDFVVNHKKYFNRAYNIFNVGDRTWLQTDKDYFIFDLANREFVSGTLDIKRHVVQYNSSTNSFWTSEEDRLMKEYWEDGVHQTDTVLSDVNISQVFVDSEGNTWLGSSGNGLYKYFIKDFDRCSSDNLNSIFAIQEDTEGAMWLGSLFKGLWKIRKGKVSKYPILNSKMEGVTTIGLSPAGEVWVGTTNGLGKYIRETDSFKWFTRLDGLPAPFINQVEFDRKGNIWMGTNGGGVGVFDGKKFGTITLEQGLPSRNAVSVRYMPFNQLIYAGTDAGLSVIREGKASSFFIKELENTGVNSLSVYREKILLIGSGGAGVILYNVETGEKKAIDTHVGLPSDFIYFVAADDEELLWIGTEKGISKVKLDKQLEIEEFLHFGYDNGLAGVETNQNAFFLGKEKFFGLIDGVYQYNDLRNEGWHSFDLHLTDIELFNGEFPIRDYADKVDGFFKLPVNPNLPSDKNHITFHFNRVDKRYPKSVRYKYILQDYDKAWSLPSSIDHVTYGNLPPGDYVFVVKATNNQGSWDKKELKYAFTIRAPFYQTAAFQIGLAVFVLGLIGLYFFYRVRTRFNKMVELQRIRQQEQDSLRKEIARDFHDEMGNQLTRIINYISLMKLSKNGHAVELYNKVEDSAKYLYTGTRDFIWSIDPVNDELSKLFIHIRDFGDKLFTEKDINFRAYNEVKGKVTVPYGFSREANLIFKEAMTNSFNHSQAKNVSFTLKQESDQFEMILEDDGKGFVTDDVDKLNGVKNMRSRADRIQSFLHVQSVCDQGTVIGLVFSIKQKNVKYGITL